jgi:hypothetical protein
MVGAKRFFSDREAKGYPMSNLIFQFFYLLSVLLLLHGRWLRSDAVVIPTTFGWTRPPHTPGPV